MGIRHADQLALVRWVGQDFLVAGQRGVEDDFPKRLAFGSDGPPAERGAVFQHQPRNTVASHAGRSRWAHEVMRAPWRIVFATQPTSSWPANGVFAPFETNWSGSTVHRTAGSMRVRLAGWPVASPCPLTPAIRAGAIDRAWTSWLHVKCLG